MLDDFLRTTIPANDANVTISGRKIFNNTVTFQRAFTIDGSLNDLDLHRFHERAVYIDKPLAINSDVVFKRDVHVQRDISVKRKLRSSTIRGVDMRELHESVIALDRVAYFPGNSSVMDEGRARKMVLLLRYLPRIKHLVSFVPLCRKIIVIPPANVCGRAIKARLKRRSVTIPPDIIAVSKPCASYHVDIIRIGYV